jgi:hypothetical protein
MGAIDDFTQSETWSIETTLKERWPGRQVELQPADVEIRMYPDDRELTEVPAIFWEVDEASFVVFKVSDRIYCSQFYYRGYQQYGAGKTEFDDITECVVALLQAHADKEAMNREEAEKQQKNA